MLIGCGTGVAVAVGSGVGVSVAVGANVFVAFEITVGGMIAGSGTAACGAHAVKRRTILTRTNKAFFKKELLAIKKTGRGGLLPPLPVFFYLMCA